MAKINIAPVRMMRFRSELERTIVEAIQTFEKRSGAVVYDLGFEHVDEDGERVYEKRKVRGTERIRIILAPDPETEPEGEKKAEEATV